MWDAKYNITKRVFNHQNARYNKDSFYYVKRSAENR